jgi:2-methylisocitrate lyase-like PEP mutase family enzyme
VSGDLGRRLRELHGQGTFVLVNAWDAGSAAVMVSAGAAAVGTTSSGVSWSLGVPDGEHLRRDEMVQVTSRIARAVSVPVSADIEAGYGAGPHDVADTIAAVIDAGAVGANLEDRRWPTSTLVSAADQCERIAAARAAADRSGVTFTLNARTDVYLVGAGEAHEREEMVVDRARQYAGAGADCLFVPGLIDSASITRIVDASPLPLNVLLAPERGPAISELVACGVRRISVGHTMAAACMATVRRATEQLLNGEDIALRDALPISVLQDLMSAHA